MRKLAGFVFSNTEGLKDILIKSVTDSGRLGIDIKAQVSEAAQYEYLQVGQNVFLLTLQDSWPESLVPEIREKLFISYSSTTDGLTIKGTLPDGRKVDFDSEEGLRGGTVEARELLEFVETYYQKGREAGKVNLDWMLREISEAKNDPNAPGRNAYIGEAIMLLVAGVLSPEEVLAIAGEGGEYWTVYKTNKE